MHSPSGRASIYPYWISLASTLRTHGAIVKVVAGDPQSEVRVRSRCPVAMRRALSAYSVNLLFCTMYGVNVT